MVAVGSVWPRPISAINDTPITSLSRHPHPPTTRTPPYSSISSEPRQRRVSVRLQSIQFRRGFAPEVENVTASCGLTACRRLLVVSPVAG